MKKITFKLLAIICLLISTITNAQTATITTINGIDAATYLADNTPLTGATAMEVVVEYTNADNDLNLRFLNNWTPFGVVLTKETIKGDSEINSITFNIDVPEISPAITEARLQVFGSGGVVLQGFEIAASAVETSAAVAITTINSMTPAEFHTGVSGELTEGEVLTVGVDYAAIKPNLDGDTQVLVRVITNDYKLITEVVAGVTTVTNSDSSQSTTVSFTVPDLNESLTAGRLQVGGFGFDGVEDKAIFSYVPETFNIDHTVLSSKFINKTKLENAYYDGNGAVIIGDELSGDYTVYTMLGSAITKGVISSSIDVSSLASGVYILATEAGYLKFVK